MGDGAVAVPLAHDIFRLIVENDVDGLIALLEAEPEALDERLRGFTPLALAAQLGHHRSCEALLEAGAHPEEPHEDGCTPLVLALTHDRQEVVDLLLSKGSRPDQCFPDGTSLLGRAVLQGDRELVERLLRAGADPDFIDEDETTPLGYAVRSRRFELWDRLLEAGASIEETGPGASAMAEALGGYPVDFSQVQRLLDLGYAVPQSAPFKDSLLLYELLTRVRSDQSEAYLLAKKLLGDGARVSGVDRDLDPRALGLILEHCGPKAFQDRDDFDDDDVFDDDEDFDVILAWASLPEEEREALAPDAIPDWHYHLWRALRYSDDLQLMRFLGVNATLASYNEEGETLLTHASFNVSYEPNILRLLLEMGADPAEGDGNSHYPLECAVYASDLAKVRLLLEAGAPPQSGLLYAAIVKWEEVWDLLVEAGADPQSISDPLQTLAQWDEAGAVRFLLRKGFDPNHMDDDGNAALHIAADSGYREVCETLLLGGAQVNLLSADSDLSVWEDRYPCTPAAMATVKGHVDVIRLLLASGLDPRESSLGTSLLHGAASFGHWEICQALIEAGEIIDVRDADGETPLASAVKYWQLAAIRTLLQAGADPRTACEGGLEALLDRAENDEVRELLKEASNGH